ncbi:hypothetical protein KDX16_09000 [Burkholderia vietnamiensis]|uniref:hypothetical protein n=1 Tax=Burkholderia vietnamiensis TaxID=60552 RepID=UPI0012D85CE9|nr:hypothetical protein [Burkholderia vietnamiensis]MBR7915980.1 hypothetical protein [Burkholderia vietnamiensis]HDR9256661.1 hypothetical protein [Burkholderia vietnamiensis]
MKTTKTIVKLAVAVSIAAATQSSFAYTECKANVQSVYAGSDGTIVAVFDSAAPTSFSGQYAKNMHATLLTAISSGQTVLVRWAADGVPCNNSGSIRGDTLGIWINRN